MQPIRPRPKRDYSNAQAPTVAAVVAFWRPLSRVGLIMYAPSGLIGWRLTYSPPTQI